MESEENRGLINKKDYEDHFLAFCLFIFGALIFYSLSLSLSLSHTLGHLEFSWRTL